MLDSIKFTSSRSSPTQNLIEPLYPFKPGDLITFSGLKIDAALIRYFTGSDYSHTAIVLDSDLEANGNGKVAIAESTSYTSLPDFRNQKCKPGVQIHYLENWLNAYRNYGQAWWVPLAKPLSSEGIDKMQNWLWNLHERQVRYSCWKSIGAWLKVNRYLVPSDSQNIQRIFCSELVTQALQIAGSIDESVLACQQTPKEAVTFGCFEAPVLLEI
ncbi:MULTISPECIES: hypothetical protein [unclassified Moorena]|uniref:hypothetical protein n=1 Tax=unclassified Moorena TaxID=2683338 RepID=UPI0013C7EAD7|nr:MULTISPECIES: hypothetical protein [unclassified Moorena]NEO19600.1 hypothetical protein [Moorena sp. SIO4A5]NEQ59797.1 hypothetical protein [Moorena sp. SIO4A1]